MKIIHLKVSDEQHQLIKIRAVTAKMSMQSFVLLAVLSASKGVESLPDLPPATSEPEEADEDVVESRAKNKNKRFEELNPQIFQKQQEKKIVLCEHGSSMKMCRYQKCREKAIRLGL